MHLPKQDDSARQTNITTEELNGLPLKAFTGKITLITDVAKLSKMITEIEKHDVVGFDTETRPSFKKGQSYKVALIQLAIPDKVFLIRLHDTGLTDELISLFQNPNIMKAGVAIRDDIKFLQKLKHFEPAGFIELATLSKASGLQVESVKNWRASFSGSAFQKVHRLQTGKQQR